MNRSALTQSAKDGVGSGAQGRRRWRRLISAGVSFGVLAALYRHVDLRQLPAIFAGSNPSILVIALTITALPVLASVARMRVLARSSLPYGEGIRVTLAAGSLNMILPSRMGELAKAFFLARGGHLSLPLGMAIVIYEKGLDLLSLLLWLAAGLLIWPDASGTSGWLGRVLAILFVLTLGMVLRPRTGATIFQSLSGILGRRFRARLIRLSRGWLILHVHLRRKPIAAIQAIGLSLLAWLFLLSQTWLFFLALGARIGFIETLARAPLAILAGLVPFTLAGVGTRDMAFVEAFENVLSPAVCAGVGLLYTLRYAMLAVAGLPFMGRYVPNAAVAGTSPDDPHSNPGQLSKGTLGP